jgi:hypothetical protein
MDGSRLDSKSGIAAVLGSAGRAVLSFAAALAGFVLLLALTTLAAASTLEHGVHRPVLLDKLLVGATIVLRHLGTNFSSYCGWYLTVLGLCSAGAEIVATKNGVDFYRNLSASFTASIKPIWSTLSGGLAVAVFAVLALAGFGNNHAAAIMFWESRGAPQGGSREWIGYLRDSFVFDLESRLMLAVYVFLVVAIATLTIAGIRAAWALGFWGFLTGLMTISSRVARLLGVEGASAPIASIILIIVGMLVAAL